MFLNFKWHKIILYGRGDILQNQMMFLKSIWSTVDATLEFFMTARGVILLVFYSYRVFPFEMETFDLEMMTSNFT